MGIIIAFHFQFSTIYLYIIILALARDFLSKIINLTTNQTDSNDANNVSFERESIA